MTGQKLPPSPKLDRLRSLFATAAAATAAATAASLSSSVLPIEASSDRRLSRRLRRRSLQQRPASRSKTRPNVFDDENDDGRTTTTSNATKTETKTKTKTTNFDDKSYKICSVLGGLDVTRHVSSMARSFFAGAIDDVEFVREYVSEAAYYGGIANGMSDLIELSKTYDWIGRGRGDGDGSSEGTTTTVDAGLGYCDDRPDRRMERYVSVGSNSPLVGTKGDDMAMLDAVSSIFPWIVDRKSRERSWHLSHRNGRSEGPDKEPFLFESLYQAAWIGSYGEAWAYYPPLTAYGGGEPLTFGDVLGPAYDSHDEAFVSPNLPENNVNVDRSAFFTDPYPDTAVPGLSLITAMAPVYYTGTFRGNVYEDTYLASTGIDIAVSSVSTLLDALEGRLTDGSFGMIVDVDFNTIVLSQSVVERIYPRRTGFESTRVERSKADPNVVVHDRRNRTYLVSDTILQPLTNLTNADWIGLNDDVKSMDPGERGHTVLDVTVTGRDKDDGPTEFYVMYERWEYVADWVLLAFAPVTEVENAVRVEARAERIVVNGDGGGDAATTMTPTTAAMTTIVSLEGRRGDPPVSGRVVLSNLGTLDATVEPRNVPPWIRFGSDDFAFFDEGKSDERHPPPAPPPQSLPAGRTLIAPFTASTDDLELGTSAASLSFLVRDDRYPDCFHSEDVTVEVTMKVLPRECDGRKVYDDDAGVCVCPNDTVGEDCVPYGTIAWAIVVPLAFASSVAAILYVERKRRQADSLWSVKSSELRFDDPPEIAGRGTFGLVLLAEYRGTRVAVKRVIPPKAGSGMGGTTARRCRSCCLARGRRIRAEHYRNPMLGKGDWIALDEEMARPPNDDDEDGVVPPSTAGPSLRCCSRRRREERRRRSNEMFDAFHENGDPTSDAEGAVGATKSWYFRAAATTIKSTTRRRSESGWTYMLDSPSGIGPSLKSGRHKTVGNGRRRSALKRLRLRRRDEYSELKSDFVREMRHLSKLRHPCITTVMGAVISKREEPMLVMEYMDLGSLYDVLHNETMVVEGELVLPILRDIAQGIRFLHSASPRVVHGDLKAQNVLVDIKMRAKVADFGLSQKKKVGATGTPPWMAPELLRGEASNAPPSDVYSFGIVLYEVYSREEPYRGEDYATVLREICDPLVNRRPGVPPSMPPSVVALMSDCLVSDAESRPTFHELDDRLRRMDVVNVEPGRMMTLSSRRTTSSMVAKAKAAAREEEARKGEAERNANLLLEVFPKRVADALRDGRRVEPEYHDCVSIVFLDIVGFTTISASVTPLKVSDMLDRLYLAFDDLSRKHEVFKIDTIGDAWMGVSNLDGDQSNDHARRVASFAIDALDAAGRTPVDADDPDCGHVRIRVGFHSGPVLSAVVGSRNPKFSIFGDAVNTSSRMESHSLPGRIHCSDRAGALLKVQCPDMPLVHRGAIAVKGKGEMDTYWVNESPGKSLLA